MKAIYVCPKCKKEKIVNSFGDAPHFKRYACECGQPLHFKEIVREEDAGTKN